MTEAFVNTYQPEADLEASRTKLIQLSETQVEIDEKSLFTGVLDVLASRGGERWRKLDELRLKTKAGMRIMVGYEGELEDEREKVFLCVNQTDGKAKSYEVVVDCYDPQFGYVFETVEISDKEIEPDNWYNPVSNWGYLAPARLYAILADAHRNSPLEEMTDDHYCP